MKVDLSFLFATLISVFIVLILIVIVATVSNEKACLEAGYPQTRTTWDLEGYCLNLEGTVTVKVNKL